MLKDKLNRKLLLALAILAVLYAGSYWLKRGTAGSEALTRDLAGIDTGQISRVTIEKPGSHIELTSQSNGWQLTTEEGELVPALDDRVENMLSALDGIYPSSVATHDPGKWRDYQVDSTGQRVQVFEGEEKTLDLIIGRSGMQGRTTFITYVRPFDEDNVYVIENFSGSSVSASSANYRDKTILNATVDSIRQLVFIYEDGDDFTLRMENDDWKINDMTTDSTLTADYLDELRRMSSSSFVDQSLPAAGASPASSLTIISNGEEDILIQLYDGPEGQQILHSSQNPDNYFADTAVVSKLFWSVEDFVE